MPFFLFALPSKHTHKMSGILAEYLYFLYLSVNEACKSDNSTLPVVQGFGTKPALSRAHVRRADLKCARKSFEFVFFLLTIPAPFFTIEKTSSSDL